MPSMYKTATPDECFAVIVGGVRGQIEYICADGLPHVLVIAVWVDGLASHAHLHDPQLRSRAAIHGPALAIAALRQRSLGISAIFVEMTRSSCSAVAGRFPVRAIRYQQCRPGLGNYARTNTMRSPAISTCDVFQPAISQANAWEWPPRSPWLAHHGR
jgi:hypothetical protein